MPKVKLRLPLKKGDNGPHVQVLQGILLALGCNVPTIMRGHFGPVTRCGVEQLQDRLGLEKTGIFDERLHKALEAYGLNLKEFVKLVRSRMPYAVTDLPEDVRPKPD